MIYSDAPLPPRIAPAEVGELIREFMDTEAPHVGFVLITGVCLKDAGVTSNLAFESALTVLLASARYSVDQMKERKDIDAATSLLLDMFLKSALLIAEALEDERMDKRDAAEASREDFPAEL